MDGPVCYACMFPVQLCACDTRWIRYQRIGSLEARAYICGEEHEPGWRKRVALSPEDARRQSLVGGMIARNPLNHDDQWYIAPEYFAKNYALAPASVVPLHPSASVGTDNG